MVNIDSGIYYSDIKKGYSVICITWIDFEEHHAKYKVRQKKGIHVISLTCAVPQIKQRKPKKNLNENREWMVVVRGQDLGMGKIGEVGKEHKLPVIT